MSQQRWEWLHLDVGLRWEEEGEGRKPEWAEPWTCASSKVWPSQEGVHELPLSQGFLHHLLTLTAQPGQALRHEDGEFETTQLWVPL